MSDNLENKPAGKSNIDINSGARSLSAKNGMTLLAAMRSQNIYLPSACGGKGLCGMCRLKFRSGAGHPLDAERKLISHDDLSAGVRLACQHVIAGDVAVDIPPEIFDVKKYRGKISRIRQLTGDIKEFRIELLEPDTIKFVSGQYVQLMMPRSFKDGGPVWRAYSVAGSACDEHSIELIIRLVPGGTCSVWACTQLKVGDEVTFVGPYGQFRVSEDCPRPMIWIAGGSGMSPFWSMVRCMKSRDVARKCIYFFGAVRKQDLFYVDELSALARELPWFEYIPALSAPAPEDNWTGRTGLITQVVDSVIADGSGMDGYLCGSPGMIDASVKVLRSKGVPEDRIFYDKFA